MAQWLRNPRVVDDANMPDGGVPVVSATVDMGANEFQPADEPDTCPADVTGNSNVDTQDLLELLAAWGACP